MHLALGDGEFTSHFAAYERQARPLLTDFVADGAVDSLPVCDYPEPVEHCVICRWSGRCKQRRRSDVMIGVERPGERRLHVVVAPQKFRSC